MYTGQFFLEYIYLFKFKLDQESWNQAALPVQQGGLRIRKASNLAMPAYFSSLESVTGLANTILPGNQGLKTGLDGEATAIWNRLSGSQDPPNNQASQRAWDCLITEKTYNTLIQGSQSVGNQARLKAATGVYSGAWLESIPIPSVGTRLDDESVRVAVSLRLGTTVCLPHTCRCRSAVQSNGLHGLNCSQTGGRHARHSELNTIIHRFLTSINQPFVLEPVGMTRSDGRRPDGLTLFPWQTGRPLVWDATCVATLAPSNLMLSQERPGAAATRAEERKTEKYRDLAPNYHFTPLGFETMGN